MLFAAEIRERGGGEEPKKGEKETRGISETFLKRFASRRKQETPDFDDDNNNGDDDDDDDDNDFNDDGGCLTVT